MLTEKDYCDYETCVALEEVGMLLKTQIVRSYAKEGIQTSKIYPNPPSLYEAQKWLREEKSIHVVPELGLIHRDKNGLVHYYRVLVKDMNSGIIRTLDNDRDDFESYEEALSKGIRETVKILKENGKAK